MSVMLLLLLLIGDSCHVYNFWIWETKTMMTDWRWSVLIWSSRIRGMCQTLTLVSLINCYSPVFAFFEELFLIIWIQELWEQLSIISKIVYKMLECFPISIEKDFIIDDFQLVKATKHSFQEWTFALHENISFCRHMMSSSYVERNNFSIKFDSCPDFGFISFPLVSFSYNLISLLIKSSLHVNIERSDKFMILNELSFSLFELLRLSLKFISHGLNVLIEHILNCFNSYSPSVNNVSHSRNLINKYVVRQFNIKIELKFINPSDFMASLSANMTPSRSMMQVQLRTSNIHLYLLYL